VERVAGAVCTHFPYAWCFSCLACLLDATEGEVRKAARLLAARGDFRVRRRVCYWCRWADDALMLVTDG
jgi:hypothetical protein